MASIAENLQVIKNSLYNIKTTIVNHGGVVGNISTYAEALEEIFNRYEEGSTPSPSTTTTPPPTTTTPPPTTPTPSPSTGSPDSTYNP